MAQPVGLAGQIARVKVLASEAVTYLVGASAVVTIFSDELTKVVGGGQGQTIAALGLKVGAWLGASIAILRRVQTVDPTQRGLLPVDPAPAPPEPLSG